MTERSRPSGIAEEDAAPVLPSIDSAIARRSVRLTRVRARGPRRESVGSSALALLFTLAMLAAISGVGRKGHWRWSDAPSQERQPVEEIVLLQSPPATRATAPSAPAVVPTAMSGRLPAVRAIPRVLVPPSPAAGDSAPVSPPSKIAASVMPSPLVLPTFPRPTGQGGSLGISTAGQASTKAGRDSAIAAIAAGFPSMSRRRISVSQAERDSVLRMQQLMQPPGGRPELRVGGSIAVGLPGGGPTRAQRKRDSTLDAGYQIQLARIRARLKQRADSDSIARASGVIPDAAAD